MSPPAEGSPAQSHEPRIVFLPARTDAAAHQPRPSILLVFFPGAFVAPERHVGLCRAIQSAAANEADVHVGIGRFSMDLPGRFPEDTAANVAAIQKRAVEELERKTSKFDAAFVAGHSTGGYQALSAALPLSFDGAVLLSSTSNSKAVDATPVQSKLLASYPKPVLTAIGNRDGFMRMLHLADEMDSLDRYASEARFDEARKEEMLLGKPVLALNEINHMQLGDGIVSEKTAATGRSDIDSNLSLEEAWRMTGEVVADFLLYHATGSDGRRRSLLARSRAARDELASYRELSSPSFIHRFAERLQMDLLAVAGDSASAVKVHAHSHETKEDFLYSKPSLSRDGSTVHIHVGAQDGLMLNATSMPPQLTRTLAIKWKSREGVLTESDEIAKAVGVTPPSLSDLNRRTFDEVLQNHVTLEQRERYFREGRQLDFLPDVLIPIPPEWVDTAMELTCADGCGKAYLRSPYVTTPPNSQPAKTAGMWYGKPLSPAQAYEYIVFDAFKKFVAPRNNL